MSSFLSKIRTPSIDSINSLFRKRADASWQFIPSNEKKKIVILGSGWGGYAFAKNIDCKLYDVSLVSPRNHFLFTPLLPSTTTGTLEFRCITEPIRSINNIKYHQARCMDIDNEKNQIICRDSFDIENLYPLAYDYLIYSIGSRANDFGINGVREHAYFLKQIRDAMKIRDKIQELFERAIKPTTTKSEVEKLLSIVIVGGGPTSIEFTAELHDWLIQDGSKMFPDLIDKVNITLLEATDNILSGFGSDLAEYTMKKFRKRKIRVMTSSAVVNITRDYVELNDGYQINYGLCVWATGIMQQPLTNQLNWNKSASNNGRIIVDEYLKCFNNNNIYCIGDCSELESGSLPPTAQVAHQQGKYLAKKFNYFTKKPFNEFENEYNNYNKTFGYVFKGTMAYIGNWRGVVSLPGHVQNSKYLNTNVVKRNLTRLKGLKAWLFWRSAYLNMTTSNSNKILIPMYWFKTWAFGRDFSRF